MIRLPKGWEIRVVSYRRRRRLVNPNEVDAKPGSVPGRHQVRETVLAGLVPLVMFGGLLAAMGATASSFAQAQPIADSASRAGQAEPGPIPAMIEPVEFSGFHDSPLGFIGVLLSGEQVVEWLIFLSRPTA